MVGWDPFAPRDIPRVWVGSGMLVVSAILSPVPPSSAVQSPVQSPRRFEESHPVLDEIMRLGPGPVDRWELIQALESDLGGDRRDLRERRAEVFRQIDDLVRRGRLVKLGRYRLLTPDSNAAATLAAADNRYQRQRNAAPRPTRITRPLKRTARDDIPSSRGRAPKPPTPVSEAVSTNKLVANCLLAEPPQLDPPKPNPTGAEISEAARALGKLREFKKRWSGYVNGQRVWRGREIELPDGRRAFVYGALRGTVAWSLQPVGALYCPDGPHGFGATRQELIILVRNAHAQLLGRRKRGVRERPSKAKAAAARINGRMPPRSGSRPRGRPRMVPGLPRIALPTNAHRIRVGTG